MTNDEFLEHLTSLRLTTAEAAQLLGASDRSVRRWAEDGVPGPAAAAVRAWRLLEERRLPWKPDSISILERDQDQLDRIRAHDQLLAQVMVEVEQRGGPSNPWTVDIGKGRATFSHSEVGFYKLQNGGFSVSTYRRLDRTPTDADKPEIADAVYCIAKAFARAATARDALRDIADYTRRNAHYFVQEGPGSLSPTAAAKRRRAIEQQADALDALAAAAGEGRASYGKFEEVLSELHHLGFFPETALVSAVAHSLVGGATPVWVTP
jgi:hypothetical protein